MTEFIVEEHLGIIKRLMMVMGIWPKENPSLFYISRGFVAVVVTVSMLIVSTAQALQFVDIESTFFILCTSMATLQGIMKYFFLFIKRKHFSHLLKMLREPILSLHDDHIYIFLRKKMKIYSLFQNMYLYATIGTGMLIITCPLLNTKNVRPVPIPLPIDMEKHSFLVYVLVWLYESYTIMFICISHVCIDGLMFFFNSVASAELRILREKIMKISNFQSFNSENLQIQDLDDNINNLLRDCVIQHIAIERYILCIQSTFSYVFLVQLLASLVLTCFMGFMCILVPITSINFGMCMVFFMALLNELALICVTGNEITSQSENIRDACYMFWWHECGPSVRKTLFIIMERSKCPFRLSAANFAFLSLDTLVSVFKSAYSYFTVLKTMYGNSKEI